MTDQEIEACRQKLTEILAVTDNSTIAKLKKLALKVGASAALPVSFAIDTPGRIYGLTHNIHFALQTASMAYMCESATKGYKIAEEATRAGAKSVRMAMWIALASALAAWAAVIVGIIIGIITN